MGSSGLLTCFSPNLDLFAISSGNGRIKIWDTFEGNLQTEISDLVGDGEANVVLNSERGHLSTDDYTCMKWLSLERKKKGKPWTSLLVLGTGSGDVLALDVSAGQLKWKITHCHHPGGVSAVSSSNQGPSIYTSGADGMVCEIDPTSGNLINKFKASTEGVSSAHVFFVHGLQIKPTFEKIVVNHGEDLKLNSSKQANKQLNLQSGGLHGTTIILVKCREGCFVSADSRRSNETGFTLENPFLWPQDLIIDDTHCKIYTITPRIGGVMVGDASVSLLVKDHMISKCSAMQTFSEVSSSLRHIYDLVKDTYSGKPIETAIFGTDRLEGSMIHFFKITYDGKNISIIDCNPNLIIMGSGSYFVEKELANALKESNCLCDRPNAYFGDLDGLYFSSFEDCRQFVKRLSFLATLNDPISGGPC